MDWRQARDKTLERWRGLRESIGQADEVDLLVEINVIGDLCRKARDVAEDPVGRCEYCLAYQQFGGCHGANLEMSERVVEHDWEGLRLLVDRFIDQLEAIEIPPERID